MNNKATIVTLIVVAIIAISALVQSSERPQAVTTERVVTEKLGAVATLDGVDNPYVSVNGRRSYDYRQTMAATSSVVCSRQNPFGATSTLADFAVQATANGLGSQKFDVSTSSTALGSSTPAFIYGFTTGTGQFSAVWGGPGASSTQKVIGTEPSGSVGNSLVVIGPSEYVTVKVSTSTAGTFGSYLTGTCQGKFVKL